MHGIEYVMVVFSIIALTIGIMAYKWKKRN